LESATVPPASQTAENGSELQIDHARAVTLAQVETSPGSTVR
jgi:hypothetical protein